jgi:hypothetical protein
VVDCRQKVVQVDATFRVRVVSADCGASKLSVPPTKLPLESLSLPIWLTMMGESPGREYKTGTCPHLKMVSQGVESTRVLLNLEAWS